VDDNEPEEVLGFDWDEEGGVYAVVGRRGKRLADGEVTSTPDGLRQLLATLDEYRDPATGEQPVVVVEMTRRPVLRALMDHGVTVHGINAGTLHGLRAGRKKTKSDLNDATWLARRYRTDPTDFRPISAYSADAYGITLLSRQEKDSAVRAQRAAGRVRSLLAEFYPAPLGAWKTSDLFDDPVAATVLLAAPTPEEGRALTLPQITELVRSTGKPSYIADEAEKAYKAMQREFLTYDEQTVVQYGKSLTVHLEGLLGNIHEHAALDKQLVTACKKHPFMPLVKGAVGSGPKVIARLIGEIGDERTTLQEDGVRLLRRFPTADGFAAFAGVSPLDQSSHSHQEHVRRDVKGNRLHRALWDWAEIARQHSAGPMHFYWSRREAGDHHSTAIRKVAFKLAIRLHRCLTREEPWVEAKAWPSAPPMQEARQKRDEVKKIIAKRNRPGNKRPTPSPARTTDADSSGEPSSTDAA